MFLRPTQRRLAHALLARPPLSLSLPAQVADGSVRFLSRPVALGTFDFGGASPGFRFASGGEASGWADVEAEADGELSAVVLWVDYQFGRRGAGGAWRATCGNGGTLSTAEAIVVVARLLMCASGGARGERRQRPAGLSRLRALTPMGTQRRGSRRLRGSRRAHPSTVALRPARSYRVGMRCWQLTNMCPHFLLQQPARAPPQGVALLRRTARLEEGTRLRITACSGPQGVAGEEEGGIAGGARDDVFLHSIRLAPIPAPTTTSL